MAILKSHRLSIGEDFARGGGPTPSPLPPHGTFDVFNGDSGNNNFNGTAGNDTFNMADGGDDNVSGGASADTFNFGNSLTSADKINGGGGNDTVNIDGNYTGGNALVFGANTMNGVENLVLSNANYDITTDDATVTAAISLLLTVDGSALTAGKSFTFNGSAETDGHFSILAGDALALLVGGAGDDQFAFGGGFTAASHVDGGQGTDELILNGDYSAGLTFAAITMINIERLTLTGSGSYRVTLDNGNVPFDRQLIIDGTSLGAISNIIVDGSDETSAKLVFEGGSGNCTMIGGGGDDSFRAGAGFNAIKGGGGDDGITFSGPGFGSDTVDGGAGFDTLFLTGSTTASLSASSLKSVEKIAFAQDPGAANYFLLLNAATIRFGEALTIDGHNLDIDDRMTVDASAAGDGSILVIGGAGIFNYTLSKTGHDVVRGGTAGNNFNALGNLEASDRLSGQAGADNVLNLAGDYSDRLEFENRTIHNIETINLLAGHTYNLALADGNVASGATLSITGSGLGASDRLILDGSKESNGNLHVTSGAGNDLITGGAGNDTITTGNGTNTVDLTRGGNDTVTGGTGNDTYIFGAAFTNSDVVTTFGGNDTLSLDGNYATATFNLPAVRFVQVAAGNTYILAATLSSGTMSIAATHLGPADVLAFTGGGAGTFSIGGGSANDNLAGGSGADSIAGNAGDDLLRGNAGQDSLAGGAGKDTFIFGAASESTSITFDKISAANFSEDRFDVVGTIGGIDAAVASGALRNTSKAVFDSDLTGLMNGHLQAGHAILFTCNGGNFIGEKFLIVDQNGSAGYQADADLVIRVTGFTGTLGASDFI